ncbi:MAG: UvrD-helicase domain-containing protein [Clostridia bacterium]|nr:UvrD-helicase domain-containing protein [Clostridia bacterium]
MELTVPQKQAIEFKDGNLLVSAAAGSGKTSTLIKRIVERLKDGEQITDKLIVTFTISAASKLRADLIKGIGEEIANGQDGKHLGEQLIKAGNADICTIDAFCMKLVRANFDRVGIDADFRIGEQSEIDILSKEAMEETLDTFFEAEEKDADFLTVCDCFGDMRNEDKLAESLLSLYSKLITTKEGAELLLKNNTCEGDFMDTPHGKILCERIVRLVDYYKKYYGLLIDECMKDGKTAKSYAPTLVSDIGIMDGILSLCKSCKYDELKTYLASVKYARFGIVKGECSVDTGAIRDKRDTFKAKLKDIEKRYFSTDHKDACEAYNQNGKMCRAIYKIIKAFEDELFLKKKAHSIYSFNDVERFALCLLCNRDGSPTDTALEYRKRYNEVYIDEYQDTNSIQDEIFKAISNGNRFMVGDIKQSIYKFRSAEPEIFAGYRDSFTPVDEFQRGDTGAGIFMSNNFRSDKGVIDFANLVSDYMFKGSQEIPYGPKDRLIFSKARLPEGYPHEKAEVYLIKGKRNDETEENPEADFVARKIKSLIEHGYLPSGNKIQAKDITILLRTRTCLNDYINALKRHGVNYQYENEELLYERSEILLVMCLLNVIDNPMRDVYLAGAMRSPAFDFTLSELVAIRQSGRSLPSLYASCKSYPKEDKIRKKLDDFFEKIEKYRKACRKLPSHEVISMLYTDFGLLGSCTKEERKSLLTLYDIARKYESGSYKGIGSFLRYTDRVVNDKIKEHVSDNDGRSVEIMTVHGSKGLQRHICFLCDTARGFNTEDIKSPIYFDRFLGVSGYIFKNDGLTKYNTLMRKCTSMAMVNGIVEEEMRKLYVALTRAENKMIVTGMDTDPVGYICEMKERARCQTPYSILNTTSCLDWIVGACSDTSSDFFEMSVIDGERDTVEATDGVYEEEVPYSQGELEKIKRELKKRLEFKYKNEHINKVPSKLSASKLSKTVLDSTENEEVDQNISLDIMPTFLTGGEKQVTGSDIGTATHLFLQFCDFGELEKNGVDKEMERLRGEYLSESVCKLVNKSYIEKFMGSRLFTELREAKSLLKEFRYNILLPANDFSEKTDFHGEKVLVQGVVDCIYERDNGELVLVDYKTDSVNMSNYRQILVSRHKNQLSYYKKACEMMMERPISQVLIYSVPLGRSVFLPDGSDDFSKEE